MLTWPLRREVHESDSQSREQVHYSLDPNGNASWETIFCTSDYQAIPWRASWDDEFGIRMIATSVGKPLIWYVISTNPSKMTFQNLCTIAYHLKVPEFNEKSIKRPDLLKLICAAVE